MKANKLNIMAKLKIVSFIMLSGCSIWNEDFEDKVIRAHPKSSIHQLSRMADKGLLNETIEDTVIADSSNVKVFKDGDITRTVEDVRRMYISTYEDASKNLHIAHYLYFVVSPSGWIVK